MSNSYRIRTKPGVDSSVRVLIDQEFEYLEILSLKILQNQIYTRQCSDYGVIVGRVSVNNGLGIPNAKVSVFIPLEDIDENDPVISDLYPYKTLTDLNEDGYRYNLLPYKQQHGGHTATGTFFTREDVLTNPTLIEVYDKYYKFNAVTNESGDYMIFGVPAGSQTVVVDIDLSDIGEFSLSPQDLIRMGVATENQVAGTKFKSSTNLRELPQILTFNRTIEVEPLWGQPDICNLGITRTDFDVSAETNINITPTAIFMGSLVSSNDDTYLKKNCKSKPTAGDLCNLVTGPGEILAIRQTIEQDIDGRPILESFDLDQGGQVIDDNGTWMIDVPMNMDYITTNEFGERIISSDPKVGVPTKSKYRFKVKWNQSPSLGADPIKRGYYLVPNIKEYGWDIDVDPLNDGSASSSNKEAAEKSYAFSLDWSDYGNTGTTIGQQMIQEAINCEDRFFEMSYNKVYTVSQLISQYRKGYGNSRIISIKDILNSECQSENNKFPTNDAVRQFDIIFLLFQIFSFLMLPVIYTLVILSHVLAFLLLLISPILAILAVVVFPFVLLVCGINNVLANLFPNKFDHKDCPNLDDLGDTINKIFNLYKLFTTIQVPNLAYPDCEMCDCEVGVPTSPEEETIGATGLESAYAEALNNGSNAVLTPLEVAESYVENDPQYITDGNSYEKLFAGALMGVSGSTNFPLVAQTRAPQPQILNTGNTLTSIFTSSLPIYERINLFNTKAKYFDNSPTNPGGGVNRIKVSFNTANNVYHYDNVIVLMVRPDNSNVYQSGNIVTFQQPSLSSDSNITGYTTINQFGTTSITGTTINNSGGTITVQYADYSNPNNLLTQTYTSQQNPNDSVYARFPMDIEYFQVITGMTYSDFDNQCSTTPNTNSLNERFLKNTMNVYKFTRTDSTISCGVGISNYFNYTQQNQLVPPLTALTNYGNQKIIFLVRGVDPNTTRQTCSYDLSLLFGYNSFNEPGYTVTGQYKLNHPVKPGFKNTQHNIGSNTTLDSYSNNYLYHDSYHFLPSSTGNASFSSFTSNMVSHYSSLDSNNLGFVPQSGMPTVSTGFTAIVNGLKVKSNNMYTREYTDLTGNTYTQNTTNNRGYFENEIVEGGSGLYGNMPTTYSTCGSVIDSLFAASPFLSIYYAPAYSTSTSLTYGLGGSGNQIVMRSDRLPTSSVRQDNINNSFPLQSNLYFSVFVVNEDGTSVSYVSQNPVIASAASQDNQEDQPSSISSELFNTFNCGSMIPLGCYKEAPDGTMYIAPEGDDCYKALGGKPKMINGCYNLVSFIFVSLPSDIVSITEWLSRLTINFAACRNVFGHLFTNNWINGVLYPFSFRNDVVYSSPTSPNPNQLISANYCKDVVTLHPTTNFYYRSSPYSVSNNSFIGKKNPTGLFGSFNGNEYSLQFPTTMMDLGPRADYLQDIILSDGFDGYVANKLNNSSYSDVSDILNLFIITRLANTNFLSQLTGSGSIGKFFSRDNNMVDADYAQSISVNSEIGVAPFETGNYTQPNQIYVNSLAGPGNEALFGIFFTSDTQVRDYITPKRTILNPNVSVVNPCAFNEFGAFTQEVPMYQWGITPSSPSIFGTQKNDWYTTGIDGVKFFSHGYQSMDRLLASSRYFRTNNNNQNDYFKGYIYSVDGSGQLEWSNLSKSPNTFVSDAITVGAPYHFYFGLKRGKTAYDRFLSKWVDTNKVVA
mgnify:FL=1|jgi:hypothetical protein